MKFICSLFVIFILISCSENISLMNPPKPEKIPFVLENHGDVRTDNYYWLRDDSRSNQKIINYLKEENKYSDLWFNNKVDYQSSILNELIDQLLIKRFHFLLITMVFHIFLNHMIVSN